MLLTLDFCRAPKVCNVAPIERRGVFSTDDVPVVDGRFELSREALPCMIWCSPVALCVLSVLCVSGTVLPGKKSGDGDWELDLSGSAELC